MLIIAGLVGLGFALLASFDALHGQPVLAAMETAAAIGLVVLSFLGGKWRCPRG
jgi:hypothetical protein